MKKYKEKNFVKKVRAKSKTQYYKLKDSECFICGNESNLELHHILPLSEIIVEFLKKHEKEVADAKNDEDLVVAIINECNDIFEKDNVVTLCKQCHYWLHNLFGASYKRKTAEKVKTYLINQRRKKYGQIHRRAN